MRKFWCNPWPYTLRMHEYCYGNHDNVFQVSSWNGFCSLAKHNINACKMNQLMTIKVKNPEGYNLLEVDLDKLNG